MHHANGVVWEAVSPPPPPPDGSRANRRAESPPTAAVSKAMQAHKGAGEPTPDSRAPADDEAALSKLPPNFDSEGYKSGDGTYEVRLLPIRPRSRGARRSLRTFPVVTLHPRFPFNV